MTTEKDLKPVDREFPKVKYQGTEKGAKCVTVRSAEEEAALGEGWLDGHDYWKAQRERDETPEPPADDAPELTRGEELRKLSALEQSLACRILDPPTETEATPIDEPRKRKGKA